MAITRTIGKNTLGDNNKMHVSLREYDMSSQNLSYVFRSTMGVGMLVPFMKIVCQKGDIFDIKLTNRTMTHPTLGPLFGSFKLQHFIFTAGFRLYNSWLHNNRTGIGMKMSDIKFPTIRGNLNTSAKPEAKFNPSSLYSYIGWRGTRGEKATDVSKKNAIPALIYLDIFKNYFANTQEDKFYIIADAKSSDYEPLQVSVEDTNIQNGVSIKILMTGNTITIKTNVVENKSGEFENVTKLVFTVGKNDTLQTTAKTIPLSIGAKTSNDTGTTWTINKTQTGLGLNNNSIYLTRISWTGTGYTKRTENSTFLKQHNLEMLDKIRDEILKKPGNEELEMSGTADVEVNNFFEDIRNAATNKLGGLILKTYDSDIFNNWVKTDWIDGENGISKITALKPDEDGTITMDALNLQQKVYNMLNRIAVSGGTYRDWLETVYTAGRYLDRPETPVFQGGMSQMIEFDEVVATTGNTEGQVLGELAGRGYARQPNTSGRLHFQVEEPGYVFGVMAITPMIDYSQGNDFDLNLFTMDDLHKPALDGIGYQDLMNEQRAWWTAKQEGTKIIDTTPGKSVAWIDYMTNFNKTFGNFAAGESEDFMVLNRNYERDNKNGISNGSTYINPQEHIDIFADTALDSQNFWVQTACEITRRGNYSAKQIPNF